MAKASRALLQAKKIIADNEAALGKLLAELGTRDMRIAELETMLEERNEQLQGKVLECDNAQAANRDLAEHNGALGEQLEASAKRNRELTTELTAERSKVAAVAKERDQVATENNGLRDELHRLTVAKAHIEGQLARVQEFDPVTDQQVYRDGITSVERFVRRSYEGSALSAAGAPWYRRG